MKRGNDERPKKCDRVPHLGKYAPGPGWYNLSGETMVNQLSRRNVRDSIASLHSFGSQQRKVFESQSSKLFELSFSNCPFYLATPGPGTYVAPSAFGYYLSD